MAFQADKGKGTGVAFQPSYTIQPKYGFRYLTQPFVDTVSGAGNLQNPVAVPDTYAPPKNISADTQDQTNYIQDDTSNNDNSNIDNTGRTDLAQSYGYTPSPSNPMMLVPGGAFISDMFGAPTDVGKPGTFDTEGNVYGEDGKSYDIITGQQAGYATPGDFYDARTSSYDALRDKGLDPVQSFLGTYEGSYLDIPKAQQDYGANPATRDGIRNSMGDIRYNTAIENPELIFTQPQYGDFGDIIGYTDPFTGLTKDQFNQSIQFDDADMVKYRDVSLPGIPEYGSGMQAFNANKEAGNPVVFGDREKLGQFVQEDDGSYSPSIGTGTVVNTAFGPGVVNSSGQVETAQGTVIQMSGVNNNNVIQKPTQVQVDQSNNDNNNDDYSEHQNDDGSWDDYSFNRGGLVPSSNAGGK